MGTSCPPYIPPRPTRHRTRYRSSLVHYEPQSRRIVPVQRVKSAGSAANCGEWSWGHQSLRSSAPACGDGPRVRILGGPPSETPMLVVQIALGIVLSGFGWQQTASSCLASLGYAHQGRCRDLHAVDLVWGLGTLHRLTQQEPAP